MARILIDIKCASCDEIQEDRYVDLRVLEPHGCGGRFERVVLQKSAFVHGDDIPGGLEIQHGICHPDGSPKKFYTKSAIAKAAADAGYHNHVEHLPEKGTDKSPHTQRWI